MGKYMSLIVMTFLGGGIAMMYFGAWGALFVPGAAYAQGALYVCFVGIALHHYYKHRTVKRYDIGKVNINRVRLNILNFGSLICWKLLLLIQRLSL